MVFELSWFENLKFYCIITCERKWSFLPIGYVLNIDSIISVVRLYFRPLHPSVSGLMSARKAADTPVVWFCSVFSFAAYFWKQFCYMKHNSRDYAL